jgi:hypothetical protein
MIGKQPQPAQHLHDVCDVVHLRLHARHLVHLLQVVVSERGAREARARGVGGGGGGGTWHRGQ